MTRDFYFRLIALGDPRSATHRRQATRLVLDLNTAIQGPAIEGPAVQGPATPAR